MVTRIRKNRSSLRKDFISEEEEKEYLEEGYSIKELNNLAKARLRCKLYGHAYEYWGDGAYSCDRCGHYYDDSKGKR